MLTVKHIISTLAEQIADNDARQELARLKLQDEVEQMKMMANVGGQSTSAADADRARRISGTIRLEM